MFKKGRGTEDVLQGRNTCLVCARSWIQSKYTNGFITISIALKTYHIQHNSYKGKAFN